MPEASRLPEAYGTGKLMLAARDPHWLYACWDLTGAQQRRFNALSAHHHLVLRAYADHPQGRPAAEAHVHPESQHWFLQVDRANTIYLAELGYYTPDAQWVSIAVSPPAAAPPDAVADEKTVLFATIPLEAPLPRFAPPSHTLTSGCAPAGPALEPYTTPPPGPAEQSRPPAPIAATVDYFPNTALEQNRPAAHALPLRPPEQAVQPLEAATTAPKSALEPPHTFPGEPFARVIPQTPGAPTTTLTWTIERERALREFLGPVRTRHEWIDSMRVAEATQPLLEREREISSPAAAQFGQPVPTAAAAGISSPRGGEVASPPGLPRQFWFNVNAELILYGATEPDARVTIGGRPVRLRPDGTFSYRFALPDGDYELVVRATAAHGDSRQARLEFARTTTYQGDVGAHPQDSALTPPSPDKVA